MTGDAMQRPHVADERGPFGEPDEPDPDEVAAFAEWRAFLATRGLAGCEEPTNFIQGFRQGRALGYREGGAVPA